MFSISLTHFCSYVQVYFICLERKFDREAQAKAAFTPHSAALSAFYLKSAPDLIRLKRITDLIVAVESCSIIRVLFICSRSDTNVQEDPSRTRTWITQALFFAPASTMHRVRCQHLTLSFIAPGPEVRRDPNHNDRSGAIRDS
ncbi:hypothetical protein [Pantoea brenneri]|uniref:hypothetical protein n=1 Tax=Pantoea brenneri TaxID=472694 RepID=UPI002449581C|nr:hypothetical protein [Pantoea brenneri]MDH1088117.1 hypothetical protein [Pantoea brenneri]